MLLVRLFTLFTKSFDELQLEILRNQEYTITFELARAQILQERDIRLLFISLNADDDNPKVMGVTKMCKTNALKFHRITAIITSLSLS